MDLLFMIIFAIVMMVVAIIALGQMIKMILALLATPIAKIIVALVVVYAVYTYGKQLLAHFSFGTLGIILVSIIIGVFVLSLRGNGSYHGGAGYSSSFDDDDYKSKKKSVKRKKQSSYGNECPRCGAQMIWMPEQSRRTGDYEYYEDGHWEYDYSKDPDHPTSVWVNDKYRDPVYETIPAHYYCPSCGYGDR